MESHSESIPEGNLPDSRQVWGTISNKNTGTQHLNTLTPVMPEVLQRLSAVSEYLYLLNMLALKVLAGVGQSQDALSLLLGDLMQG